MYTSPSGKKPDAITPGTGTFHNDDRSLYSAFWPPRTPEQIEAFDKYVAFMVEHFEGRIHYWALWNEPDIGYWNPWGIRKTSATCSRRSSRLSTPPTLRPRSYPGAWPTRSRLGQALSRRLRLRIRY